MSTPQKTSPAKADDANAAAPAAMVHHSATGESTAQLYRQLQFEELLSEISARLVRLRTADFEEGIVSALQLVAEVLEVERVVLFEHRQGELDVRALYHWTAPGMSIGTPTVKATQFPYALQQLFDGETFGFSQLDELPADAALEKEYYARRGVKSHIAVPLQIEGAMFGGISCSVFKRQLTWPREIVRRLALLGDIFAGVLSRNDAYRLLADSELRYRGFVANSSEGIWRMEFDEPIPLDLPEAEQVDRLYRSGYIPECNDVFAKFYGFDSAAEMLAAKRWTFADYMPRELPEVEQTLLRAVRSQYRMTDLETIEIDQHGNQITFLNNFIGEIEDGALTRVWGTARDVTAQRNMEQDMRLRSAAIEAIQAGCVIADATERHRPVTFVNEGFTAITGYRSEDVLGNSLSCLQGPDTDDGVVERMRNALNKGEPFEAEILNYRKDGRPFWNNMQLSPVRNNEGKLTNYVGILTDVTERKRADAERHRLRDELSHVDRVATLGELSAAIAHEINQPLAATRSNAHAIQRFLAGPTPDLNEISEAIVDILSDNERAIKIIREMRSLLSKGAVDVTSLPLNELVEQIPILFRGDSVARLTNISFALDPALPPVLGERVHIQQVLLNLCTNALDAMKATPPAQRMLALRTAAHDAHFALVTVTDSGPGFSGKDPEQLFEAFQTTKADGFGMGLTISRTIIEAQGGRMWGSENHDGGATFSFTLPFANHEDRS